MSKKKRVYAYFDGSNFYHLSKLNYGISKIKFHYFTNQLIKSDSEKLVRMKYFTAPVNQQECPGLYSSQLRFFDKMRKTPLMDLSLGKLARRRLNSINIT